MGDAAQADRSLRHGIFDVDQVTDAVREHGKNPFLLRAHAGEELMLSLQETSSVDDFEPMRCFVITVAEQLRDAANS